MDAAVREIAARWSLRLGEAYPGDHASLAVRAESPEHGAVVLKVTAADFEALHEGEGLRFWDGDGTVRVHDEHVEGGRIALLLERAEPGTVLKSRPETEQDVVVAAMLRRLWRVPAPEARFRSLGEMCAAWADERDEERRSLLDPGLERAGIHLFCTLPETAPRHVLLCTDLHAGNIVAAEREPWLVIDPKPFVGDPHYDALQHLLNCPERLTSAPLDLVARMADLLDLDRERLRLWLFARCVQQCDYAVLRDVARAVAP